MGMAELDAIALLKADHRKVEGLFDQFERGRSTERKKHLAEEICAELTVHTIIEEDIFYPACRGKIDDKLVDEAYVEHDGAKMLISELEAGGPGDDFYDTKVKVLSENIKRHVHEEEKRSEGIFAQAKGAGLDLDELGARLQSRKQELMKQIAAEGLPLPTPKTILGASPGQEASQAFRGSTARYYSRRPSRGVCSGLWAYFR
jgi:hypothetical protein